MRQSRKLVACLLATMCACWIQTSSAQTTSIGAEYLMTYVALLEPPYKVDDSLVVVNVKPGGWAKGPRINGTFIAPGADWLRIMPSGVLRLDVRATLQTDDGALIYITYNGIAQHSPESFERSSKGETLKTGDMPYFITAPTFQTSSAKYAWLNGVQAINKLVELKLGEGGYVKYDVFVIR
jgi:hypothetical protein